MTKGKKPMIPERRRPDPVPDVRPIWEYQADDRLRQTYEDYKRAFQVPWVGVAALALANYRTFFECWWRGMGKVVESRAYVERALAMRGLVEDKIAEFDPPPIAGRLRDIGYSERELSEIRDMIEFFSHGNFIQIPAFFSVTYLLEGGAFSDGGETPAAFGARHAPRLETPFVLMEPHHAAAETRAVYDDIKARVKLPFVNTDYRALSRWPSYFKLAWEDLRGSLDSAPYNALTQSMHEAIFETVAGLPNPAGLTPERIAEAATNDASVAELLAVSRVFTYLIPGLIVNVAFFRHQLQS